MDGDNTNYYVSTLRLWIYHVSACDRSLGESENTSKVKASQVPSARFTAAKVNGAHDSSTQVTAT